MKFIKPALVFGLCTISALGDSQGDSTDLFSGINKAHKAQISSIVKRDRPAEIDVLDSNTVPVEDSKLKSLSLIAPLSTSTPNPSKSVLDSEKSSVYGKDLSTKLTNKKTEKVITSDENNDSDSSNHPFLMAISMIVVSEIGDKTFLISALMAMRHSRIIVFSASFASLAIMTVLSGIVGHALPTLISQRLTQFLAAGLFVVFGFKLAKEGLAMPKGLGVEEELAEVEEEIQVSDLNSNLSSVEGGGVTSRSKESKVISNQYINQFLKLLQTVVSNTFSPLWIQVFVMIFLGEWGDRSQIATIAMAAGSSYWAVIFGAVVGHGLCTAAAVIGGKILASKISMRTVTLGGAFAFFVFAILYFYEALGQEQS
ncbi:hypothetical protein WICMUC_001611 [Wickerhamomyces mucosus]|uniref:GDT1 family protein n=1 Tax=Wickerhamomyces mucosus TaxID=1378264 RepID=A0A9P8PTV7_9ASCO|nr:hypothetical protein WICMUC_001611 [Wickerhamomyces mucosus]